MPSMLRRLPLLLLFCWLLLPAAAQIPPQPTTPPGALIASDSYIRGQRLGITHIASEEVDASEQRYRNALLLGAGWNRWPLYWNRVETAPGQWNWANYDRLVTNDVKHGLRINAILLNRPDFHAAGDSIASLSEPVFADGTDTPGPDKTINPGNPWAVFTYEAVQRYKPGGLLARQRGWVASEGIRIWEVWNEPDFDMFWRGGVREYARLLKVAYLAAKLADPQSVVMFGGLLYPNEQNWLALVLDHYLKNDPAAPANGWYMDAVGVHSYAYPWRSGWLVLYVRQTMRAYNFIRPIWLNESGVPAWDDYPGPAWTTEASQRLKRASAEQQAWFFVQSTVYAFAEGAEVVMYHQLYDDCGDQPPGTNFPPHRGELCVGGGTCFGDAFGLFRNERGALCYGQHPFAGTPRPVATAYRLVAEVFGREPFSPRGQVSRQQGATIISFERPNSGETIRVIWNLRFEPNTITLETESRAAQLYTLRGSRVLTPINGSYTLELEAAQPDNLPDLEEGDRSGIGGPPVILIESPAERVSDPGDPRLNTPGASGTPSAPAPVDAPTPAAPPTLDPALDATPPQPFMEPLPILSPPTFTLRWGANDASPIEKYLVFVRVDGGTWQPWLETARTQEEYSAAPGTRLDFAVWAQDAAGNWSENVNLTPMASTRVQE